MSHPQIHLPGEILSCIFTFIRQEPRQDFLPGHCGSKFGDLCACSLVSQTWRPFAQAQLFFTLTYTFLEDVSDSEDRNPAEAHLSYGADVSKRLRGLPVTLRQLFTVFSHSPHLALYVRFLDLRHASYHSFPFATLDSTLGQSELVDPESIFALVELFPQLRSLSLSNVMPKDLPTQERRLTIPRALKIAYDFPLGHLTLQDLMALILLFEKVNSLEMVYRPYQATPDASAIPDGPVLKPVEVETLLLPKCWYPFPIDALCTVLLQCLNIGGIRTLELGHAYHPAFRQFLDQVGQSITSLTVNMLEDAWLPGTPTAPRSHMSHRIHVRNDAGVTIAPVDVKQCRKLQKLIVVVNATRSTADMWHWYFNRLAGFVMTNQSFSAHPELREITIRFIMGTNGVRSLNPHLPSVQAVDELLVTVVSQSSVSHIALEQNMEFVKPAVFTDFMQTAFPVLNRKGMLRINAPPSFDPLAM